MKILRTKVKKLNLSTFLNIKYQNEVKVNVNQLKKHGLIEGTEELHDLPEDKLTKIIKTFANHNPPAVPKGKFLSKGKHGINKW